MPSTRAERDSNLGEFFAVDRRLWPLACDLGINAAVAYLTIARGSNRDNRVSRWSIQAIENYTGISRRRAGDAIDKLCEFGLMRRLGDKKRPSYELTSYEEQSNRDWSVARTITARERSIYEKLVDGQQPSTTDRSFVARLVGKGFVTRDSSGFCRAVVAAPEWIWLPNTLVTGAAGELPPVELTRQMQDPMILRLLVDLYYDQNLREYGGVSRLVVYQEWERARVGQCAQYVVWGFRPTGKTMAIPTSQTVAAHFDRATKKVKRVDASFWARLVALENAGLFEWIPYLFESVRWEAEAIHPYRLGTSQCIEDRIGRAAREAALRLLTPGQADWARDNDYDWLVPVPRHIGEVAMIGVARLRYRARTKLTAAWSAELESKGARWFELYNQLGQTDRLAASR